MITGTSTETSRNAALSMFDEVPCFFQLVTPSCEERARWIAYFTHEEPAGCGDPEPWPLCDTHRQAIRRIAVPFWRVWSGAEPMNCGFCGIPLRVERIEALS